MPTYQLGKHCNDTLMRINSCDSWPRMLPSGSTSTCCSYKVFGWEDTIALNLHTYPTLLKPDGNGKLPKRTEINWGFPFSNRLENKKMERDCRWFPRTMVSYQMLLNFFGFWLESRGMIERFLNEEIDRKHFSIESNWKVREQVLTFARGQNGTTWGNSTSRHVHCWLGRLPYAAPLPAAAGLPSINEKSKDDYIQTSLRSRVSIPSWTLGSRKYLSYYALASILNDDIASKKMTRRG